MRRFLGGLIGALVGASFVLLLAAGAPGPVKVVVALLAATLGASEGVKRAGSHEASRP